MKLSLEQFRERLVDYLYGMLDGDALRDFEQCLAESEVCRRELLHMRSTLQTARQELVKDTEQPPPRIRAAVLAAAAQEAPVLAAAARERKSQRPSQRPSLRPSWRPRASVPASPVPEASGFWSWLRAPWLVPTLGVAAAVAVVVLNRDVESPDLHRDASHPSHPSHPSEAAEAPAPRQEAPAPVAPPVPAPAIEAEPSREEAPAADSLAQAAESRGRASAPAKGYAAPPAAWEELRSGERAKRELARKSAAKPSSRDDLAGALEQAPASEAEAPGGAGAAVAAGHSAAPAASAPSARDEEKTVAKPQTQAPADKAASSEQSVLIKLASAHLEARRWALASETYRELLARYPTDTQVPVWRKQLALAEQARTSDAGR